MKLICIYNEPYKFNHFGLQQAASHLCQDEAAGRILAARWQTDKGESWRSEGYHGEDEGVQAAPREDSWGQGGL